MIFNRHIVIFLSAWAISTTIADGDDLRAPVPACNSLVACGPNSTLNACGSSCPLTCQNPKSGVCNALCRCGCACNDGYLLDETTGRCLLPHDCPSFDCGPNAYVSDSVTDFEPTCQTPTPQIVRDSPVHRGCKCKDGFLLNRPGGVCVSLCLVRTRTAPVEEQFRRGPIIIFNSTHSS